MKVSSLVFAVALVQGQAQMRVPVQTYFVPLPEDVLLAETFVKINDGSLRGIEGAEGPVNSLVSIAISADKTVIWYDQWEDGFEGDVINPGMSTTEVWGDGDCSNGFVPNIKGVPRTKCDGPEDDVLSSGDAILLENVVNVVGGRDQNEVLYDGGDKILSSFPIAVTRAAYPEVPGSLMAGAVEVLDTSTWGKEFIAPVGVDTGGRTSPFEYTDLYVMGCKDGTQVKVNNILKAVVNQGENAIIHSVREGDVVETSEVVQVDILAGDILSSYELRWYSLIPLSSWADDYYTPVGGVVTEAPVGKFNISDQERQTKVWVFNPNDTPINVKYMFKVEGGTQTGIIPVGSGASEESLDIPVGSGGRFFTDDGSKFFALTQTHTNGTGHVFDWGHPLVPADMLTSQALVGWGYGCEGNDCNQGGDINPYNASRTVVWVTPVADADINVDYDGDGTVDEVFSAPGLSSIRISDTDHDMTGALIFATTNKDVGSPVDIVTAWGQDPSKSTYFDPSAMDLGTVVPPLPIIDAGKTCSMEADLDHNGVVSPGDILRYTIRVVNSGRVMVPAGSFSIYDFAVPLLNEATYVPHSVTYKAYSQTGFLSFSSDIESAMFPFNSGLPSKAPLVAGGVHEVSFSVQLKDLDHISPTTVSIVNKGVVAPQGLPDAPIAVFEEEKFIHFPPTTTTTSTTTTTPEPTTTSTTTTTPEPTTTTNTTTTPEPTTTTTTTTTSEPTTTTTTTTTPEPTTTTTTTATPEPTTTTTMTSTPEPTTTTTTTTTPEPTTITTTTTPEPTTTTTTTTTTPEPTTTTTTTTSPVPTITTSTTTTLEPITTTTTTTTPEPTTTTTTTTTPEPTTTTTTTTTPEPTTIATTTFTTNPATTVVSSTVNPAPPVDPSKPASTECPLTPAIDGPECKPLLVGDGAEIGRVCAKIVDDNLEITKYITSGVCCLTECHICNIPVQQYLADECVQVLGPIIIPIELVYQFVCAFDEDEFLVAGHATAVCDSKFDTDGIITADDKGILQKGQEECTAYYEIPLKCECV